MASFVRGGREWICALSSSRQAMMKSAFVIGGDGGKGMVSRRLSELRADLALRSSFLSASSSSAQLKRRPSSAN